MNQYFRLNKLCGLRDYVQTTIQEIHTYRKLFLLSLTSCTLFPQPPSATQPPGWRTDHLRRGPERPKRQPSKSLCVSSGSLALLSWQPQPLSLKWCVCLCAWERQLVSAFSFHGDAFSLALPVLDLYVHHTHTHTQKYTKCVFLKKEFC